MNTDEVASPEVGAPPCPECGEGEPLRIAYGYPTTDMFEASERNELALGGCVVEPTSPTWRCRACRHEWGGPPSTIDGLAAFLPGRSQ